MLQAPKNDLIVRLDTKFIGNYSSIIRAANMNPGSSLNPADLVNIIGEVISIPRAITTKSMGYGGLSTEDIRVGDTAIFAYSVVYDLDFDAQKEENFYRNSVWFKGKEYFRADITKIFGVIRDGEIIMVNGWCMIEGMEAPAQIYLPNKMARMKEAGQATLTAIGKNKTGKKKIDAQAGDKVLYHPNRVQEYQIKGKKFGVLQQKDIFGALLQSSDI